MDINSIVPGGGAIFFGLLISLMAFNIIGRSFTHSAYHTWLDNRRSFYRILGPTLIIIGIALIAFKL